MNDFHMHEHIRSYYLWVSSYLLYVLTILYILKNLFHQFRCKVAKGLCV